MSIGGKRVCNSLAGSYKSRTAISDVQHNTEGHSGSKYHEFAFGEVLKSCLDMENKRKRKLEKNAIVKQSKPKKPRFSKSSTSKKGKRKHYGAGREEIDFTPQAFEIAKARFFEKLLDDQKNRISIEVETRGQRHVLKWVVIRRNLLTPSYYGRILNANNRKSYTKIVEEILYQNENFGNTAEARHQRIYEMDALQIFFDTYGSSSVSTCGMFIDEVYPFLGTSPFRLYGDSGIIYVKCPKSAHKKSVSEAINTKKISFWKGPLNDRQINIKSRWYLEIQGQLHITRRQTAYLVIY